MWQVISWEGNKPGKVETFNAIDAARNRYEELFTILPKGSIVKLFCKASENSPIKSLVAADEV